MNGKHIKQKRYSELDALRGIAALSVVLFHFTFGYDNGKGLLSDHKFYFKYGYFGVELFFLISGFVIFMTLEKIQKPKEFIVSRFSRLFPTYWASIIITVIATYLLSVPFQQGQYGLKEIIVNFTMLQYWFKIKDIDGAYWTLAVELTFYFLMLLIFIFKKLNFIQLICSVWIFLSIISTFFKIPFSNYINVILISKYSSLFSAGIFFYLLKTKAGKSYTHLLIIASLVAELFIFNFPKINVASFFFIPLFYLVFYLFVFNKLGFLTNKILLLVGSISYSLYLIHESIGSAFIYWLKKIYDNQFFYLPIAISLVLLLAYLITKYIEQPSIKFLRGYFYPIPVNKKAIEK